MDEWFLSLIRLDSICFRILFLSYNSCPRKLERQIWHIMNVSVKKRSLRHHLKNSLLYLHWQKCIEVFSRCQFECFIMFSTAHLPFPLHLSFCLLHTGCLFEKRLCSREQFCSDGEYHNRETICCVVPVNHKFRSKDVVLCSASCLFISCSWWSNRDFRIIAWHCCSSC